MIDIVEGRDYCVYLVHLPDRIKGAVRLCTDGFYSIYINDSLTSEERKATLNHELNHIRNDDFYNDDDIRIVERRA